ncbi:hypothetical protein [Pseudovibrio sp. SPO723]|uniref:maleate cis-trans isomerase family protein n=1 Tax=Nesiotobacter zosterae TaxID=392721 RepID=UPI0029C53888|nr:hypothetical protein [Pseudovibrio sp. SPO723]MDX5593483.1 hypothetical protein [Pseudovibrio sp. SPO723]
MDAVLEKQWKADGWSAPARIGVIVPHADVGPEAEFGAMAGGEVSIHGGRVHFSAMRAGGVMDEKIAHQPVEAFTAPPHLDEAVASLATSPLDAIGLAFTSSAYKHGPDGEVALLERLKPVLRGIPTTTTCSAAAKAFQKLGTKRLALINPPWFDDALSQEGADYFEKAGVPVAYHGPCGLPSGQPHITPAGLYDWVAKVVAENDVDTVFVAGNGQRAVGIIDAVEKNLNVTMTSANQVLFWDTLSALSEKPAVTGYGRLFG